ncbi:MAG: aconitate hydratase, partial [Balneolaceae bacterium]|nr:aconitate hydratase [Balneolaceae bacterium]
GQSAVIAKSYARIGWQNLANFGIVPFEFTDPADYEDIDQGDVLIFNNIRKCLEQGSEMTVKNKTKDVEYTVKHTLSDRQVEILLEGGIINYFKKHKK